MHNYRVEISGVDTAGLKTLSDEEKKELLLRVRAGDAQAREKLAMGNLRLVLSVIGRFGSRRENADDLFQVGCIGLLKAIDNFNPDLDVKFSTYAVPMIIGEVRRYLRDNNALRVSRGLRDLACRALAKREEILRRENREAGIDEIARLIEASPSDVAASLEAIARPMSLYDSVYNDGDDAVYVIDQLQSEEDASETWVENMALKDALAKLTPREKNIIERRFYKGKTQMEVAEEIGMSQAQVSRLEKGAIEKMRRYME